MIEDRYDALVPGTAMDVAGSPGGPLAGTRFVAKDVFDVAGWPTGAGNPSRRATVAPAERSATVVTALLAAGARLVGRSRTDELAYSLSGHNEVDGSPRNPAAPGHLTGGSSSGSAAAVAAGLADIGLGTDTGGSIRVPASHCGLFGLRPTHGRVSPAGLVPLAPSLDTVGWLTATAGLLHLVGTVLLDGFDPTGGLPITSVVVLDDVVALASAPDLAEAIAAFPLPAAHATLGGGADLDRWREAFRVGQGVEAWAAHGRWITESRPVLGAAVRSRFEAASRFTVAEIGTATAERKRLRRRLLGLLAPGVALLVPAAAGPPLPVDASPAAVDASRHATLTITCLASLAGAPALALPIAGADPPMGLSLIGLPGSDEALLRLATTLPPLAGAKPPA